MMTAFDLCASATAARARLLFPIRVRLGTPRPQRRAPGPASSSVSGEKRVRFRGRSADRWIRSHVAFPMVTEATPIEQARQRLSPSAPAFSSKIELVMDQNRSTASIRRRAGSAMLQILAAKLAANPYTSS